MHFKITDWAGRLGNHIIQLSNAIYTARHYEGTLQTPNHPIFGSIKLDFRTRKSNGPQEVSEGYFFWPPECFGAPLCHDQIRRGILQRYILPHIEKKTQTYFRRIVGDQRVDENTLVINIRSGQDIFTADPKPQADYMQPPLSFYKKILKTYSYEKCLIVTESDRMNPVIEPLLRFDNRVRLNHHRSVFDDISLILKARHLVLAHSSFTWCLALLSRNLLHLHQPESFRIIGVPDFMISTWKIDHYISPGEWTASPEQKQFMLDHSEEFISEEIETHDYLPRSAFGASAS